MRLIFAVVGTLFLCGCTAMSVQKHSKKADGSSSSFSSSLTSVNGDKVGEMADDAWTKITEQWPNIAALLGIGGVSGGLLGHRGGRKSAEIVRERENAAWDEAAARALESSRRQGSGPVGS